MSGSKTGSQTSTNNAEPWGPQGRYLKNIMGQAEGLYEQGPQGPYPGTTTVPFAPETESALGMRADRASMGSPVSQAAKNYTIGTLASDGSAGGVGVNPNLQGLQQTAQGGAQNPHLEALYERSARPMADAYRNAVIPSIAGRFAKAGRWGSGAMQGEFGNATDNLTRGLGDLSASIFAPAYEAERSRQVGAQGQLAQAGEGFLGRQMQAAQMAPALALGDYNDIDQLESVGRSREDLAGRQIQEQVGKYDFNQNEPARRLAQFMQFVNGNYGGQTTTQTPVYTNPAGGALGGGLAGWSVGGPWGAAIGAGLGYLGSK